MRFFLCLDRFQQNELYTRGREAQNYVTFKKFSSKIFKELEGNTLISVFTDYLRRVHFEDMLEALEPELHDCRHKSFDAIVRLLLA